MYKSQNCLFVEYFEKSKACKCFDPKAIKIIISKDVQAWNEDLNDTLCSLAIIACGADPSFYSLQRGHSNLLLVYDALMLTDDHQQKIQHIQAALCDKYDMTLSGSLSLHLGVQFHSQPWGTRMSHKQYTIKCLHDLGLMECKPAYIPFDPGPNLLLDIQAPAIYRVVVVGKLRHCTNSHLGIFICCRCGKPIHGSTQEPHLLAALPLFRSPFAIAGEDVIPSSYSDSNYLGDPSD